MELEEHSLLDAPDSAVSKLGSTDDWVITVWCEDCEECHHFLATSHRGSYDVHLLDAPQRGRKQSKRRDGKMRFVGRYESVDEAADALEGFDEDADDDED